MHGFTDALPVTLSLLQSCCHCRCIWIDVWQKRRDRQTHQTTALHLPVWMQPANRWMWRGCFSCSWLWRTSFHAGVSGWPPLQWLSTDSKAGLCRRNTGRSQGESATWRLGLFQWVKIIMCNNNKWWCWLWILSACMWIHTPLSNSPSHLACIEPEGWQSFNTESAFMTSSRLIPTVTITVLLPAL